MKMIAACSADGVIGINLMIPWKFKSDLKRFKELTTGGTVIMGRLTYESMGRPLPGRRNIIVSTNKYAPPGTEHMYLPDVISTFKGDDTAWIIGGQTIYEQTIRHASMIDLSIVPIVVDQYTASVKKFPWINPIEWSLTKITDGQEGIKLINYERKS